MKRFFPISLLILANLFFFSLPLSSCSKEKDEELPVSGDTDNGLWKAMELDEGMRLGVTHLGFKYVFDVVAVDYGRVMLSINSDTIKLSDDKPFCSVGFTSLTSEEAESDPLNVLFAMMPQSKIVIDPVMCDNLVVSEGANITFFYDADGKKEGLWSWYQGY